MADVQFDKRFAPAEATRGSWVPIDGSTISGGIPSASRGKYAQLNYIVGSEPGSLSLALSGGNVILPVSAVYINQPLEVINDGGTTLDISTIVPISAYIANETINVNICAGDIELSSISVTNLDQISSVAVNNLNELSSVVITNLDQLTSIAINNVVSSFEVRPNTTIKQSVTIPPLSVSAINFSPSVVIVEVFNTDLNIPIYIDFVDSGLAAVSAEGLPLLAESFYSVDRETSQMWIGNADASNSIDVRVIGHYRS